MEGPHPGTKDGVGFYIKGKEVSAGNVTANSKGP